MKNEPRNYLVRPAEFGKKLTADWKRGCSSRELATAEIQHRYAFVVRSSIKKQYGSVRQYCIATGQEYQHVSAVLRGQTKMQISDFGNAVTELHLSFSFVGHEHNEEVDYSLLTAARSSTRDSLGAFYTPKEIAQKLISQIALDSDSNILEPSFGDGSFLKACHEQGLNSSQLFGCEIDPAAVEHAIHEGLLNPSNILKDSFFALPDNATFSAVIGNPPFVRLRSLPIKEATAIREYCLEKIGVPIGEEASEWLPFLLKGVRHVKDKGSLALVLPYDFTYLRYSKCAWELLCSNFSSIQLYRVKERMFPDILQEVVLLVATNKGGCTDSIVYRCFETIQDLIDEKPSHSSIVTLKEILTDNRPFQQALLDRSLISAMAESPLFCPSNQECNFHIGYVSGNKDFFHPTKKRIEEFRIPKESLRNTAISSRQLSTVGFTTASAEPAARLWLPSAPPSSGEAEYIAFGEKMGVHNGYKCRKREPWWIVPGTECPDAILSVFGDLPRMVLNDGCWTISNSLLGAYCKTGIDADKFACTWYSSITRLSIEMQIHSLGGGVLVAVPREANRIIKIQSRFHDVRHLNSISRKMSSNDLIEAYETNDCIIEKYMGTDFLESVRRACADLISWRKRS